MEEMCNEKCERCGNWFMRPPLHPKPCPHCAKGAPRKLSEIERLTTKIEDMERITAEHLGELVGVLGINPPGEDVMTHWPDLLAAVERLRTRVEELEKKKFHTGDQIMRHFGATGDPK